jgi:hypothetical protein
MLIINYPHSHRGNFSTFDVTSRHFVTSPEMRLKWLSFCVERRKHQ